MVSDGNQQEQTQEVIKIVLAKSMVLKVNLSYQTACLALRAANAHPLAEEYSFGITTEFSQPKLWSLVGRSKKLNQAFLENPIDFVITVK